MRKFSTSFLAMVIAGILLLNPGYKVYAEEENADKQTEEFRAVKPVDFVPVGSTLLITIGLELFKEHVGPGSPKWTTIPGLDRGVRNSLKWQNSSLYTASSISDVLLYSLSAAPFWAPLFNRQNYWNGNLVILESVVYTAFVTSLVKMVVARERPYATFGTRHLEGVDDNLSFFSGHASMSFAAATTTSLYLSNLFPENAWWISTLLHLGAGTAAYMRIAGDKHYFTDVLVGSAVGSLIGWAVFKLRRPWVQVAFDPYGGVSVAANRQF